VRRLENRVALVTAAGSGMGKASAERFASEGAHVIVSDLDEAAAIKVAGHIAESGGSAAAVACDVGDIDQVKALIGGIGRDHGILHILYNHAGIPGPAGMDVELSEWSKAIDINQRSAFYATSFALPLLRKATGKASIIFTASVSGVVGSPFSPLYSMTKGGIVLLMRSLAVRLGPEGTLQRDPAGHDRNSDAFGILRSRSRNGHRGAKDQLHDLGPAGPGGLAGGGRQRRSVPGQR
jgi:NAD(P)-dependent dehydrogenase (short-subunit alcohol dehydrogenase family)